MFPLPLVVTVQPSRRLRLALAALHLFAVTAIWYATLPPMAQSAISVALFFSLFRYLRPSASLTLRCGTGGVLEILHGSDWKTAALHPQSTVLPGIAVLRYKPADERRWLARVILADSLSRDDFRRLRVWLRWLGAKTGSDVQAGARNAG